MAKAPNALTRPALMKPTTIKVDWKGEYVLLQVGNSTLTMHYEDALKISQWIRLRAKEAKAFVGDRGRSWSSIGSLADLDDKLHESSLKHGM